MAKPVTQRSSREFRPGYYYVTKKNPRNQKLVFKKYDPVARKHVEFKNPRSNSGLLA
jgi:large subunit ribosomal protein L33